MAKKISVRGKKFTLLNPAEKGKKAAKELKTGKRFTNDGQPKRGRNGQQLNVTKEGKAWRSGYLNARKDNANAYKAKRKKIKRGAYDSFGRVNEKLIDDRNGPVVFFDDKIPF